MLFMKNIFQQLLKYSILYVLSINSIYSMNIDGQNVINNQLNYNNISLDMTTETLRNYININNRKLGKIDTNTAQEHYSSTFLIKNISTLNFDNMRTNIVLPS